MLKPGGRRVLLAGGAGRLPLGLPLLVATLAAPVGAAPRAPFGSVTLPPAFVVEGPGREVDSLAFYEAPDPEETLLLVTSKERPLVEVWRYPFAGGGRPPLTHPSFGSDAKVNGIVIDPRTSRLYVAVSAPVSSVPVFALPGLAYAKEFVQGAVDLRGEPNLALLHLPDGAARLYVSADTRIFALDAADGRGLFDFDPGHEVEAMIADDFHQVLYVPDENDRSGVYAYAPDGTPHERGGTNRFGAGVFDSDGEGIALYACPGPDGADSGAGWLVVADQRKDSTDFEFFDRESWAHLGRLRLEGVNQTDGIASTQRPLPDHPLGLLAVIDDDARTAGLGWREILAATGLACAPPRPPG